MFSAHLVEVDGETEELQLSESQLSEPQLTGPQLSGPQLSEPQLSELQLSESQLSAEEGRLERILNRPAKVQSCTCMCTIVHVRTFMYHSAFT